MTTEDEEEETVVAVAVAVIAVEEEKEGKILDEILAKVLLERIISKKF